jgi:hypothetical protein
MNSDKKQSTVRIKVKKYQVAILREGFLRQGSRQKTDNKAR